jgi:hypothetical protein
VRGQQDGGRLRRGHHLVLRHRYAGVGEHADYLRRRTRRVVVTNIARSPVARAAASDSAACGIGLVRDRRRRRGRTARVVRRRRRREAVAECRPRGRVTGWR